MDESLSHMEFGNRQKQAVLTQIKGEPMKKKISAGLVFALVTVLVVTTALAVAYWMDSAKEIAQMEAAKGYFDTWEAGDRTRLVQLLVDSGELEASERTDRLLSGALGEEEARQLATDILVDWVGLPEDAITLMSILEKVWGKYPGQWSPEDLVWYTDTLAETGRLGSDHDIFLLPPEDGIDKAEAIHTAQSATEKAFGIPAGVMDGYTKGAAYRLPEGQLDHDPVWEVTFSAASGDLHRLFSGELWVYLDAKGNILDEPENWMFTPEESVRTIRARAQSDEDADYKRFWTHEERAAYDGHSYAIPDADAISEEAVITTATEAVKAKWGYTDEDLAFLTPYAIYRVAGAVGNEPVWEVSFYDESVRQTDQMAVLQVFMLSSTGEVLFTNPYE